jgi:hypothetical protein
MAKHLCGVATDLALRSLETFVDQEKVLLKYTYYTTHTYECLFYLHFILPSCCEILVLSYQCHYQYLIRFISLLDENEFDYQLLMKLMIQIND